MSSGKIPVLDAITGLPQAKTDAHRAAEQQELFGQRGLACIRVRDDGESAAFLNLFFQTHVFGSTQM